MVVIGLASVDGIRGAHRGCEPEVCSVRNLRTDSLLKESTRCRDACLEAVANRADSQVGSVEGVSIDSSAETEVGAGDKGRSKEGWTERDV